MTCIRFRLAHRIIPYEAGRTALLVAGHMDVAAKLIEQRADVTHVDQVTNDRGTQRSIDRHSIWYAA